MPRILSILLILLVFACKKADSTVESISPSTASMDKYLIAVNKIRAKGCTCGSKHFGPVSALSWNQSLEKAAIFHSKDMFQNKYFAHNSPNGDGPAERALAQGYKFTSVGENISSAEASQMIEYADKDRDGVINFQEFCDVVIKHYPKF